MRLVLPLMSPAGIFLVAELAKQGGIALRLAQGKRAVKSPCEFLSFSWGFTRVFKWRKTRKGGEIMIKENESKTKESMSDRLAAFSGLGEDEQKEVLDLARRHGFRENDLENTDLLVTLLIRVRHRKGGGWGGP